MSKRRWFEVDHDGLAQIAKRRGMAFIVTEPIQNAWDEDTTVVEVELTAVPGAPKVDIVVRDDSPNGFRDLADSYRMFRSSYKLDNPEQRGRFNVGEKLLLSVADYARITSTTGSVIFGPKGRTSGRKRTTAGSVLTARLRMTRAELDEALEVAHSLIPPAGIDTYINGVLLPGREPIATAQRSLSTELRSEEGGFRYATRTAQIAVYDVLPGETPHLYEMGIPIDKIACPWHVEIAQKVPLSIDRASVRFGFQAEVERGVAEIMSKMMDEDQARDGWVSKALEYMDDDAAVCEIITTRFGKAVVFDPSSPESNKLALDAGYAVVHGGELSKNAWQSVRRAGALEPAGRVFSDGKVRTSVDGVPPVPREDWTGDMRMLAAYASEFSHAVLGHGLEVEFFDDAGLKFIACCGQGTLSFNVAAAGVEDALRVGDESFFDEILIHECAHDKIGDHLTHAYHQECCRIGAQARKFYGSL